MKLSKLDIRNIGIAVAAIVAVVVIALNAGISLHAAGTILFVSGSLWLMLQMRRAD